MNALEFVTRVAAEHELTMRQITEACRPSLELQSALAALERDMATLRAAGSSTARMLADAKQVRSAFHFPEFTGLSSDEVEREPAAQAVLDQLAPSPFGRIAELEARVEQLELLLHPPSPPDQDEDTRPAPGQYL